MPFCARYWNESCVAPLQEPAWILGAQVPVCAPVPVTEWSWNACHARDAVPVLLLKSHFRYAWPKS